MNAVARPRWFAWAACLALSMVALTAPKAIAEPSPAPMLGSLTVTPGTGNDLVAFVLTTSGSCPAGSTNVFTTVFGPGLPDAGVNVVPNSALKVFPRTAGGGVAMSISNTLRSLVSQLADPQPLKGTYRLRAQCRRGALVADLGEFTGSMAFDGHHAYVAAATNVPAASLVNLAPASSLPLPTAVGSQPPVTSPTPAAAPATAAAVGAATGGGGSGRGPWLIAVGALVTLGGLWTILRSRRSPSTKLASP